MLYVVKFCYKYNNEQETNNPILKTQQNATRAMNPIVFAHHTSEPKILVDRLTLLYLFLRFFGLFEIILIIYKIRMITQLAKLRII